MEGLDIVMVIAIILFARLGVRLVTMAIKNKKDNKDENWSFFLRFAFLPDSFFRRSEYKKEHLLFKKQPDLIQTFR